MTDLDDDRIVRMKEFAKTCGVARGTIYLWIENGLLPRPLELGPRARGYRYRTLREFLASRKQVQA